MQRRILILVLLCLLIIPWLRGQVGFKAVQDQVVEHRLKNGLKFLKYLSRSSGLNNHLKEVRNSVVRQ